MRRSIAYVLTLSVFLLATFFASVGWAGNFGLEKKLVKELGKVSELVEQIASVQETGAAANSQLQELAGVEKKIRISNRQLEKHFSDRQDKVNKINSKAKMRHSTMFVNFQQEIGELLQLLDSLPTSGMVDPAALENLHTILQNVLGQQEQPIVGALPYRTLSLAAKIPAMEPTVTPAYLGGDRVIQPEDLAASAEAPISADIAGLAESLEWNPMLIYEWVKNNVATEWYWGCMKGAAETMKQKSGNDCDQAALLVALLRSAGFPARYVQGVIEFFPGIEKAKNLTGIDDAQEMFTFFRKAGIPVDPVIAGGSIRNLRIEHIWVEAEIPYSNYRGAVIDEHGKTWLGLDTSIKPAGYTENDPAVLPANISLEDLRDTYLSDVRVETPMEYVAAQLGDALSQSMPGTVYNDLLQTRDLNEEILKIIPASLQFKQVAVTAEYTAVPDELMHRVSFAASKDNTELFAITLPTYELSNKSIAVTFEPETVEDIEIMNSYGGLDNTPSYLIRLRPVLTVAGERMAISTDGLAAGEPFDLDIQLTSPAGTQDIANRLLTGNLAVIGLTAQKAITPDFLPLEAKNAERLLHEAALEYISQWNEAEEEIAKLLQLSLARPAPTLVTLGGVMDVTYMFGTPHETTWKGVYVDADLRVLETGGGMILPDGSDPQKTFMQLSSLEGSVLEATILEQSFLVEAVSTARILSLANSQQIPLATIDSTNVDAILPTLPFADNIKEDITNAVNQGLTVTIPEQEITYQDWTGIGWLKEDSDTGASGWMLSGSIAGGMTVWSKDKWDEYYVDRFQHPFVTEGNYDPEAGVYIRKLTASDLNSGTVGNVLDKQLMVVVQDENNLGVVGADVTFTVKAGGGLLLENKTDPPSSAVASLTVKTVSGGIAGVWLLLGESTSINPTTVWVENEIIGQRSDEIIVDALLPSGVSLASPLTAYALPGPPVAIRKIHGDNQTRPILSWGKFLAVTVEDVYGNPLSNQEVIFTVDPITVNSNCSNPAQAQPTYLVSTDAPCKSSVPTYTTCEADKQSEILAATYPQGASVDVFTGGAPKTDYIISVISGSLNETFTVKTSLFGSCDAGTPPDNSLLLGSHYQTDLQGYNINAGRVGTSIPVKANMYFLSEQSVEVTQTFNCEDEPDDTCPWLNGTKEYFIDTAFTSASLDFNGQAGSLQSNGIYSVDYNLGNTPGKQTIIINGEASKNIQLSVGVCESQIPCEIADAVLTLDGSNTIDVYAVDFNIATVDTIMTDERGYAIKDYQISYQILPAEYSAGLAHVNIHKTYMDTNNQEQNEIVAYISSETQGLGTGTIARGFQFDLDSTYHAEVVLNMGTGVEIISDIIPLNLQPVIVGLVPDFDRNRVIDSADDQSFINGEHFYFWLNDDDDEGEVIRENSDDIPGAAGYLAFEDRENYNVDGLRDLIDFFPLKLTILPNEILNETSLQIKLRTEEGEVSFAYTDLTGQEAGHYLTDLIKAQELASANVERADQDGRYIDDTDFINRLKNTGEAILLVEGREELNKKLILEIYSNGILLVEGRLNLHINPVETMFRHENLRSIAGGTEEVPDRKEAPNFPDDLLLDKNLVFIYGYNVDEEAARGWHSEMFKRFYWSGSKAKFIGISWFGNQGWGPQSAILFQDNVINAFITAPEFAAYIEHHAPPGETTVAAHSLGNMVVASAIQDHGADLNIDHYFMINAAITREAISPNQLLRDKAMIHKEWRDESYDTLGTDDQKEMLLASEWYRLFKNDSNDHRNKLTWKNRFNKVNNLDVYNFHSPTDDILLNFEAEKFPSIAFAKEYPWCIQELFKGRWSALTEPDFGLHDKMGWGFNDYETNPRQGWEKIRGYDPEGVPIYDRYNLQEITDEILSDLSVLKAKPFFRKGSGYDQLYGENNGSSFAQEFREKIMAKGIPARSYAIATGPVFVGVTPSPDYDMSDRFTKKGWPVLRGGEWQHSDIKAVAYPYISELFDTFVANGGLK